MAEPTMIAVARQATGVIASLLCTSSPWIFRRINLAARTLTGWALYVARAAIQATATRTHAIDRRQFRSDMHFLSEETRQLMSAISREQAVPLSSLMALAASAFTDGLRFAASAILPRPGKGGPEDS
jgi:hypothetical protein